MDTFTIIIVIILVIGVLYYFMQEPLVNIDDKNRITMAVRNMMDHCLEIAGHYGEVSSEDFQELMNNLNKVGIELEKKNKKDKSAVDILINCGIKETKKLISKHASPEAMALVDNEFNTKIRAEMMDIIVPKSELKVENIFEKINNVEDNLSSNDVFQQIWKDQTNQDFTKNVREIKKGAKNNNALKSINSGNGVLNTLISDNPTLYNDNSLLPKNRNENLELANIVASQNRFYTLGSKSVLRDRGGDDRPLPKALIDKIMQQGNSSDPNSLMQSEKFDAIDILENGRGNAGNEYINYAVDLFHRKTDSDFIKSTEVISRQNMRQEGSLNVSKQNQNAILSDILTNKFYIESH